MVVSFFFLSFPSLYRILTCFKTIIAQGLIYLSVIWFLEDGHLDLDLEKLGIFNTAKIAFLPIYWNPVKICLMTALEALVVNPSPRSSGIR